MPRLKQFNYWTFNVETIKLVEIAAQKAGEQFEYESSNAQMIAKGVTKAGFLNFDVGDEDKWSHLEMLCGGLDEEVQA